jgi:2-polyprenyl-3-methyl-5-hydroxy-6-metoxy-1,4-benzoquinol methylase
MNIYEKDVFIQLQKSNFNFINKKCLDIGTRNGLNCINLINLFANNVIGIDLDGKRFNEINEIKLNDKINLIEIDLLNFNDDELFDVITCFLWNMNIPQYQDIINKIKSLLKPDGTIFIGFHDEIYKYGYIDNEGNKYSNTGSVPELLKNHFKEYKLIMVAN